MADKVDRPTENSDFLNNARSSCPPVSTSANLQQPDLSYPSNMTEYPYRNAREYAQTLHNWLWQYRASSAMQAFHYQMLSMMPPMQTIPTATQFPSTPVANGYQQRAAPATQAPAGTHGRTGRPDGQVYKIPMLWKRIAAEILDFILLFYIKILVTVAVLRQMGYMGDNPLDLDVPNHFPLFMESDEIDYDKLFSFTSELIALEIVNRVCITIVETLCIHKGFAGIIGGATPGKKILRLKVISFDEILDQQNGYVRIVGAQDPGIFGALIRSVIKNFSMAFFFPACFTVFFFRFNRAAYDVLGQTIVVETEGRNPL